ncbi:MAG: hypothetical protein KAG97_04470 [Victivallales bacterium]|nr:hypothetical protein [Victivallales bacterium]
MKHPTLEQLEQFIKDETAFGNRSTKRHLERCEECALTLQALRETRELVDELKAATAVLEEAPKQSDPTFEKLKTVLK